MAEQTLTDGPSKEPPLPPPHRLEHMSQQQLDQVELMRQMWAIVQQRTPGPLRDMIMQQLRVFFREQTRKMLSQLPLRLGLNNRVVCNLGSRWVGGHVVATNTDHEDHEECEKCWKYLVRIDVHPGLKSSTIGVPEDSDSVCQEVCFTRENMEKIKGAAPELPLDEGKQKLRFKVGDRVSCRVRNRGDGLEAWRPGAVVSVNAPLPGPLIWGDDDLYPSAVAYQVNLDNGTEVFCHVDNYTLIRREGLEPHERVKGLSKRIEDRMCPDGSRVRFDHLTERQKRIEPPSSDAGERKKIKISELTEAQKTALFIE